MNPLQKLKEYGQSVWLDYIRRSLITGGELKRLIEEDGLGGVTSNPAIFEKAISGSSDYEDIIAKLQHLKDLNITQIYEHLAIRDIQDAADVLRPVYEKTNRRDGYVSLEVSPFLSGDTQGTVNEARRLWQSVNRKNVMLKIPATPEGIPAIEQLIGEGMNINITLLFAQDTYERVTHAFMSGLEKYMARNGDVSSLASVASFFVSRIDTAIDAILDMRIKTSANAGEKALLQNIMGKVAIANAKLTYQRYKEIFRSPRWQTLAEKGAHTQRVLWASTGTKNPHYRDVRYVEELIGPDTVNTMPLPTFESFRDHGLPRASLEEDLEAACDTMETLNHLGISLKECTDTLLTEGVRLFADAFDKLLHTLDIKRKEAGQGKVVRQAFSLAGDMQSQVNAMLDDWKNGGKIKRLWEHDASLWTNTDEGKWLGWLDIARNSLSCGHRLTNIAEEIKKAGFSHVLLLGMGGSSLCPEVLRLSFGKIRGFPEFFVLDSTDPAQIRTFENKVDIGNTLFIVSSKSGTTLEPNIFKQYFFERVKQHVGRNDAGDRFIAITDPGSKLHKVAEGDGFRHVFFGVPDIGGRYSALSDFGMVPAAIMGLDAMKLLDRAEEMMVSCSPSVPPEDNPGVVLGIVLGVLALQGRDKITILTSPGISGFGAWLEQLLAESTGKDGKGLIPVVHEPLGDSGVYDNDRVFVYLRLKSVPDPLQEAAVENLIQSGHPLIRFTMNDLYDLGREFFRWKMATAVAGSVLHINPFNQPDVEASKVATRKLTSEFEETGTLPELTPFLQENGITLFANGAYASMLERSGGNERTLVHYLRAHLNQIKKGDYFALLAYLEMNEDNEKQLQSIRKTIRDHKYTATCLGFGPRFLHSTGQLYKGGPNTGVFIQITCDDAGDLAVPGQKYTFGIVKEAQARGDFQVLAERGRRALRVHLDSQVQKGLATLNAVIKQVLSE
ncbi:MAG: bifunctional transaldolase/phosoglucose isomerase [Candidatus Loosdrechtia sp.]|uniref:bifunctional transaldolase/phosoglucose isomerase n=1 Tax=Candidatus Loosdrechtia sp. TaxID=3101272 RepID=UPI003A777B5E|nr:MAG: bifunctional transaldolase/phosoglucose isomerase [Candidatus Jettenia sp. AMX2]